MQTHLLFGAHQFLWKSHWTDRDVLFLAHVRSLGLDFMEISLGDDVSFDPRPVRIEAASLGLQLTVGPGNVWPMHCDISHDEKANRQAGLAWHKTILNRAADLGAVAYCGAMYGHPGRVCARRPPDDEMPRTAEHLRLLADHAASLGLKLVIEPMSRFRTHLVNTAEQAMRLAGLVDHPALLVNLDTYHMITEERDYGAAIRRAATRLWGVHACENDRGVPGGGLVPWDSVCAALAESTGPIRLMLETYNTGGEFGRSRGMFQDVCPDGDAFVQRGIEFLRQRLVACGALGRTQPDDRLGPV